MYTESVPLPTPEHLAAERLVTAVESAIGGLQERLANLAADAPDAKCSVSDLIRLLQLRDRLQGERPRTITVRWVDDPLGSRGPDSNPLRSIGDNSHPLGSSRADSHQRYNRNHNNNDDQPEPDTRVGTRFGAPDLPRNHRN